MQHESIDISAAIVANPSFTVSRAALFPVLDIMARKIIQRRNTIPILSNVLIEASPSGELRLTATDLDMQLTATLPADVEQSGAFTVSATTLRDIVKKADKAAQIWIKVAPDSYDNMRAKVRFGRIEQSLQTLPRDDFPIIAMADSFTLSGEFDAVQFAGDLSAVKPAISKEETRYYLRGIYFEMRDDKLCMAATNGHSIHLIERDAGAIVSDNFGGAIVHQDAIDAMLAILKGETGPVVLDMSPSKYRLQCGDVQLYGKLIDGTFPDYRRCIPARETLTATLSIESAELLSHIATAKAQEGKNKPLAVEIEAGSFMAGVAGANGFARTLSAEYDGRDCVFSLNSAYIETFAKIGDRLSLQTGHFDFDDVGGAPFLVTIADKPEFTGTLMPMRCGGGDLPKPKAIVYVETMPARGQAADLFGVDTAPENSKGLNALGKEGPRPATQKELESYARDYASRLGVAVQGWTMGIAKRDNLDRVVAVNFSNGSVAEMKQSVTVLLPGYGQDSAPVTVQYQDDAGDYSAPMACTNAKGQIALPDAPKVRKAAKPRASTRRVFDGKGIDPAYIAAPVATPISEPATVDPVSAELADEDKSIMELMREAKQRRERELEAPQSAPETQEPDAPATLAAPKPEIALCEAVAVPNDAIETMPDPIADVMARLERLERALIINAPTNEATEISTPPSGAMETVTPLSVQSKPKRSPAHIRAIMGYLATRKRRNHYLVSLNAANAVCSKKESERDLAFDKMREFELVAHRPARELESAQSECDQLRKSLEIVQADSIRWQLQETAREKADHAKRRRALLAARVRSQAAWQLGRALLTSVDECERLKRVGYQQAGHIINLGERADQAEQMLKTLGYWPDITVTAPDVIYMGVMQ